VGSLQLPPCGLILKLQELYMCSQMLGVATSVNEFSCLRRLLSWLSGAMALGQSERIDLLEPDADCLTDLYRTKRERADVPLPAP
jgi:hypothetical protein